MGSGTTPHTFISWGLQIPNPWNDLPVPFSPFFSSVFVQNFLQTKLDCFSSKTKTALCHAAANLTFLRGSQANVRVKSPQLKSSQISKARSCMPSCYFQKSPCQAAPWGPFRLVDSVVDCQVGHVDKKVIGFTTCSKRKPTFSWMWLFEDKRSKKSTRVRISKEMVSFTALMLLHLLQELKREKTLHTWVPKHQR